MSMIRLNSVLKTKNKIPSSRSCRKFSYIFPNLSPVLAGLSLYNSPHGVYRQVNITGNNFSLGSTNGTSFVNFGTFQNIPVTYYGSNNISFVVPNSATPGNYAVQVVNVSSTVVNNIFTRPINLYSNSVNYVLT